jgi:hypothetical protein
MQGHPNESQHTPPTRGHPGSPQLLFTENETNFNRLFGTRNPSPYVKDGINDYVVHGKGEAVNPALVGTKAAADYDLLLAASETRTLRLRLTDKEPATPHLAFGPVFDRVFELRKREADEFYVEVIPQDLTPDAKNVMRQAFAGMLWSKQFYHYVVEQWLKGDPAHPAERISGRNSQWTHLYNADVISMPDKWEYPWYAAWDLAFHCVPLALVDYSRSTLTGACCPIASPKPANNRNTTP